MLFMKRQRQLKKVFFIVNSWVQVKPEVAEENQIFVQVTSGKTLLVCFVDFLGPML